MTLTPEQVAEAFSQIFASPDEMAAWLALLDKFFAVQIATAAARKARSEAVAMSGQAETVAQQATAAATAAQAEFDELAAQMAASQG